MKKEDDMAKRSFLFWKDSFAYEEMMFKSHAYFEEYVSRLRIPRTYYLRDKLFIYKQKLRQIVEKVKQKIYPAKERDTGDFWTWDKLFEANRQYTAMDE